MTHTDTQKQVRESPSYPYYGHDKGLVITQPRSGEFVERPMTEGELAARKPALAIAQDIYRHANFAGACYFEIWDLIARTVDETLTRLRSELTQVTAERDELQHWDVRALGREALESGLVIAHEDGFAVMTREAAERLSTAESRASDLAQQLSASQARCVEVERDARQERDKLLCEAIIATQNATLSGRLVCDVEKLLHYFNTHRPDASLANGTKGQR